MRLVALVESTDHVCCRYRLAAFRPHLEAAGHSLELRPLPLSWVGRVRLFRDLRAYDAVILQRKLLPGFQLSVLRRCARRLVFDFDDALWVRDSYSPKGFYSTRRSCRFRNVARQADLVVAGNQYLADAAAQHASPFRVQVVPTCVDPAAYPVAAHPPDAAPRLVWVGSSSTLQGLEQIRPILEAVGEQVEGTRLRLVCDRFLRFHHLPVDKLPWAAATEARDIAASAVGIAAVPDDPWSRGKCGLKVLQYQAAGLPVVANPIGVQTELVRDGQTGFLVNTAGEWVAAVRRLAADPGLRKALGANGRRQVEERYSVAAGGKAWVELMERFAGRGRGPVRRAG